MSIPLASKAHRETLSKLQARFDVEGEVHLTVPTQSLYDTSGGWPQMHYWETGKERAVVLPATAATLAALTAALDAEAILHKRSPFDLPA